MKKKKKSKKDKAKDKYKKGKVKSKKGKVSVGKYKVDKKKMGRDVEASKGGGGRFTNPKFDMPDYGKYYFVIAPPLENMDGLPYVKAPSHFGQGPNKDKGFACINNHPKYKGKCPACLKASKMYDKRDKILESAGKKKAEDLEKSDRKKFDKLHGIASDLRMKKRYLWNVIKIKNGESQGVHVLEVGHPVWQKMVTFFDDYNLCDPSEKNVLKLSKNMRDPEKKAGNLNIAYDIVVLPEKKGRKLFIDDEDWDEAMEKLENLIESTTYKTPNELRDIMEGVESDTPVETDDDEDDDVDDEDEEEEDDEDEEEDDDEDEEEEDDDEEDDDEEDDDEEEEEDEDEEDEEDEEDDEDDDEEEEEDLEDEIRSAAKKKKKSKDKKKKKKTKKKKK